MTNDRLRTALAARGLTYEEAGSRIGVDTKTIERWVSTGRIPHRPNRQSLAKLLATDDLYLWPGATNHAGVQGDSELVSLYPSRSSVAVETWTNLLLHAKKRINILAYAASFLFDAVPNFTGLITAAAGRGVQVRMLFGDPECEAVRIRGEEEGIGDALAGRCRLTWKYVEPLLEVDGIEAAAHSTTLYTTMVRVDDDLLANIHLNGVAASSAPLLHLRRVEGGQLWESFARVAEQVWSKSQGVPPPSVTTVT